MSFIFRVLSRLKGLIEDEKYEIIIDECSKIIESSPTEKYHIDLAKVLRGTFYILKKQHKEAMDDFHDLIVSVTFTRKSQCIMTPVITLSSRSPPLRGQCPRWCRGPPAAAASPPPGPCHCPWSRRPQLKWSSWSLKSALYEDIIAT